MSSSSSWTVGARVGRREWQAATAHVGLILASVLVAGTFRANAQPSQDYVERLHRYRSGSIDDTVRDLASFPLKKLRTLADDVALTAPALSSEDVRAAILLHTQAGVVSQGQGNGARRAPQDR